MVRDGVTNLVIRLQECGFDPRRVGPDSWESRCPATQERGLGALHHSQRAEPSRLPVSGQGELPASKHRPRARYDEISPLRGNP